jgi:hypothetical protein
VKELSLHILDVAENGINAGAERVGITVEEARKDNRLRIIITDNGRGIPADILHNVTNPFYTTRTTRSVGLGLSLLEAAARQCNGSMRVESIEGRGSKIIAEFDYDHIDRAPLGDMTGTLISLIIGYPDVDFEYLHTADSRRFEMKTVDIKKMFDDRPLSDSDVFRKLRSVLHDGLNRLKTSEE